jgi:hypothetical protein
VITVVVVVVITWRVAADVVSAYADVLGLTTGLLAGVVQQRRTATASTVSERPQPPQAD